MIGTLLFAGNTERVDICYAVNLVSQFLSLLRRTHLRAAYKVLYYLIQTKGRGIVYDGKGMLDLKDICLLHNFKSTLTDGYLPVGHYIVTVVTDADYATAKT